MIQLAWYGLGSQNWMMWAAGVVAAASSINYPAISAFVSNQAEANQQGVVQGMITGIRGLCNGLGPALYGCIFYLFHVDLNIPIDKIDEPLTFVNVTVPGEFQCGSYVVVFCSLMLLTYTNSRV